LFLISSTRKVDLAAPVVLDRTCDVKVDWALIGLSAL
jgi:hypothetical protein